MTPKQITEEIALREQIEEEYRAHAEMGLTADLSAVPDAALWSEVGRRRAAKVKSPGRAKVFRPCSHCGESYSAAELRKHKPACPRKIDLRLTCGPRGSHDWDPVTGRCVQCGEVCP